MTSKSKTPPLYEPSKILENLYLSSATASKDVKILSKYGISHIISIVVKPKIFTYEKDKIELNYLVIDNFIDSPENKDQLAGRHMQKVNDYFEKYSFELSDLISGQYS